MDLSHLSYPSHPSHKALSPERSLMVATDTLNGALLRPDELRPAVRLTGQVLEQLDRMLLGRPELHRLVLAAILSRGHLLLEGVPGVGKTALVKALGQLLDLDFKRVQFTPDLMPSDIL